MGMFAFVFFPPAAVTLKIGILEIHLGERVTVSTYIFDVQYLNAVYALCGNFVASEKLNIFLGIFWSWGLLILWKMKCPLGLLWLLLEKAN